jgi:hypothetical protein
MWREERERRWLRLRVFVFALAVCTLLTAWWQYNSDSHSIPALFYPIDAFFGQPQSSPHPPTPLATADAARGGGVAAPADAPASVGTSGAGAAAKGPDDRANVSGHANATTIVVQPQSVFEPPRATPRADEPPPRPLPCEPDRESHPDQADTRQSREGSRPCEAPHSGRPEGSAARDDHAGESAGPKR